MEASIEKECGALGGLFQQIINEMKTSSPIWEDFIGKAGKLHTAMRATILATSAFLDSFQKVADMATNTKGATRDIGSALTRLCMRHRSIENKMKHFTSALLEAMVNPMQDRMEEWKRNVIQLDKDHAKEYKKARSEIKRASSDTIRLQKKVKKGKGDLQQRLDHSMQDVNHKFHTLEETQQNAVRTALIEERSRFCHFITCLKPVVDFEVAMLGEISHLQEITQSLCLQAGDPFALPAASEQVILDIIKGKEAWGSFSHQTPPSSPSSSSLSRKSSMCSMSSINSSASSGSCTGHSPSHMQHAHLRHRAPSQPPSAATSVQHRLSSISSQDSGFTSQDTLFQLKPPSPHAALISSLKCQQHLQSSEQSSSSGSSAGGATEDGEALTPTSPSIQHLMQHSSASTWTNWPEPPSPSTDQAKTPTAASPTPFPGTGCDPRPHTISTAYEKSSRRPPLTALTFEAPPSEQSVLLEQTSSAGTASPYAVPCIVPPSQKKEQAIYAKMADIRPPPPGPKMRARPVLPPMVPEFNVNERSQIASNVYVNMNELANMAAQKQLEKQKKRESGGGGVGGKEAATEPLTSKRPPLRAAPDKHRPQRSASVPAASSQNSLELAQAIKELEASTAALENSYDHVDEQHNGGGGGGGGGTESGVDGADPALYDFLLHDEKLDAKLAQESQDVVNFDLLRRQASNLRCSTLPPHQSKQRLYASFNCHQRRPASSIGVPSQQSPSANVATIRRGSSFHCSAGKPSTPLRRNSSSLSGAMALPVMPPSIPPKSSSEAQSDGDLTPTLQSDVIYDTPHVLTAVMSQPRQRSLSETSCKVEQGPTVQKLPEVPPPPPQDTSTCSSEDDHLPLPPPPAELLPEKEEMSLDAPLMRQTENSENCNEKDSVSSEAAAIMKNDRSSFMEQIGSVRLRKTPSINDRSGPRLKNIY